MGIAIPQVVTEDRASGALVVDGSLKFDQSQSQHLTRTFGAGNRRTWTHSSWVKQGDFGRKKSFFMVGPSSGLSNTNYLSLDFDDNDNLRYAAGGENFKVTTAKFRDTGWYHVVWACDTTQAAAVDRTKIYVNGELITAYGTSSSNPSRYDQLAYNENTVVHRIGTSTPYNGDREWNDAMSQVYFIDGAALGPENFGYTDPLTNTWRPKKFSAFNNPNNGTTWTSSISGTEESGWVKSQTFDGTGASSRASNGNSLTFTPSSAIPIKTSLRINARRYGSGSSQMTVNGTNYTSLLSATKAYVTIPESTITSIVWSNVNGNSDSVDITTIEVDGFPLLDGAGDNSLYLPFDGNSPIGEDKSGNGNNWKPVNFGGSNSLDKATGAKPILNTLPGGTTATPGVFGSKAGAQYTTTSATNSGGKYVFENEGTQPTFSFIRGATYTFDYNASTGHPLRFATAADAAGSTQYTNGTDTSVSNVISFTVPHNAPNTLYYYCTNHSGMGNSISVTTDETKADPYAWKCTLAIPFINDTKDYSGEINCTVSSKTTSSDNLTFSTPGDMFYGSPAKLLGNGSSNSRVLIASGAFGFGTGDFTIEFWGHFTATGDQGNRNSRILTAQSESGEFVQILSATSTAKMQFDNNHIPNTEILNKTRHYVYQRTGTTCQLIVDGVLYDSDAQSRNFADVAYQIGRYDASNGGASLYMADFRVYTGVQKYPNSGLSIGDPVFIPASINPDILPDTPSGVSGGSKLAKIPDSITEGAVVFDGAGDYLLVEHSDMAMGTGAFTVEFSVYNTINKNYNAFISTRETSNGTSAGFVIASDAGGDLYVHSNGAMAGNYSGDLTLPLNRWCHVAYTRSGGTHRLFLNGVAAANSTTTSRDYTEDMLVIGDNGYAKDEPVDGFISNVRVIKGTALYTSNFTPPTRALTNVTNTKLLCCQSNTSAIAAAVTPVTITAGGNAVASTFSPFNTDINTVRGQKTGYCTWNPLTKSRGNLLDGNLLFYGDGTNTPRINGTISKSSGKWYYEATVLNDGPGTGSGDVHNSIGWGFDNISNIETAPNNSSMQHSFYFMDSGYYKNFSGSNTNTSTGKWLAGDVIGVAADLDGNTLTFYKNGIQVLSQTIGTTAGTSLCPAHQSNTGTYGRSISNFGQKPFKFPPPDGFQSLNAASVRPETVITRPEQYFSTKLYTGNQSVRTISTGNTPDLVWIKDRTDTNGHNHNLLDTVRGAPKILQSDTTAAEITNSTDGLTSFTSNGFTLGANTLGTQSYELNKTGNNYVAWSWKAGGNKGVFNVDDVGYASAAAAGLTGGTYSLTGASVGTKQGFSIVKWTHTNGTAGTIPHGLSKAPTFVIVKAVDNVKRWTVGHTSLPWTQALVLDDNGGALSADGAYWSNTAPTSTVFTIGDTGQIGNGAAIAYSWHDVPGLQKFGKYTGNNNANGPFIELGFRPSIIIIKRSDGGTENWTLWDASRNPENVMGKQLYPNSNAAEADAGTNASYGILDFVSNGVKIRGTHTSFNSSDHTFIYAAWAEAPEFNLYGAQSNAR